MIRSVAVTGHRPDKLGGYGRPAQLRLQAFARSTIQLFEPDEIITGMALGWDSAIARACVDLGVPFVAAVPFSGQERKWTPEQQREYHQLLAHAAKVVVVCTGGYAPLKMSQRNEWMVDTSDYLIALWNGSHGGTGNACNYARARRRIVANVWDRWEAAP